MPKKPPLLVIEHCEPYLSEWLLLEYTHAVKIWEDDIVFTRVTEQLTAQKLKKLGRINKKKAQDVFSQKKCIILDPQANKPLTTSDCGKFDVIVVGGLLGYEKPKGRTKKMISDSSRFDARHLGQLQLSIDGAVFVTKAIFLGLNLDDIEIAQEIEIVHDAVHSTILPFGYPIINNTPMITPGLVEYLTKI